MHSNVWHYWESAFTCEWGSLLEADITHSDRGKTPTSLGDGRGFGGAAVAEALPAGTAVMFGVVVLEDYVTLMAHLAEKKKTKQNNNMLLTKCQGGEEDAMWVFQSVILWPANIRLCNSRQDAGQ